MKQKIPEMCKSCDGKVLINESLYCTKYHILVDEVLQWMAYNNIGECKGGTV